MLGVAGSTTTPTEANHEEVERLLSTQLCNFQCIETIDKALWKGDIDMSRSPFIDEIEHTNATHKTKIQRDIASTIVAP